MKLIRLIFFFIFTSSWGQDSLTLQSCLDKANTNLILYADQISLSRTAKIERYFHSFTLLPNLSASTGLNASFGRRLDPFTNTFASTAVNSQSFGLNSSVMLFNGMNFLHRRNIFDLAIKKSQVSLEARQNELKIQVIELYFEICKLTKQIQFAKVRMEKYKQIQKIQQLLIQGGKINAIDTLKSYNSFMNENNLLVKLENNISLKTIDLNYLIGEPLLSKHAVLLESILRITEKPKLSQNFVLAQLEIDQKNADYQLKIDRSSILPNLTLTGLIGTGFSTNNKDFSSAGNPTKSYRDQVNQNLYEGIGFYLSIPIFNRGTWMKTKQIYEVKSTENEAAKEQTVILLEKQKIELEQKKINNKAELELTKQIVNNFQLIYDKTVLIYQEGRTTYTELEITFLDWQTKLMDLESLKLDSVLLDLYE